MASPKNNQVLFVFLPLEKPFLGIFGACDSKMIEQLDHYYPVTVLEHINKIKQNFGREGSWLGTMGFG